MRLIGLTGGIATGKSTVARMLAARGAEVIDADQVAREVVAPGTPGLARIAAAFGPGALLADGGLDRAGMRARIAADPAARATLEGITHPLIAGAIAARIAALADARVVVVEAALMVETGSYRMYPDLLVVTTDPAIQRARLLARDGAGADALIASQLPLAEKERRATWVIRNDGDAGALAREVDRVWAEISRGS
jgi:dephospho-CoA kinase